jgi:hypothetical protein
VIPADRRGRALAFLAALIVVIPMSAWALAELGIRSDEETVPVPDPAYATQGSSRQAVREAHLRTLKADTHDQANEMCGAHPTEVMAARLGTTPDPSAIADEFAERHFEVALRRSARAGCLSGIVSR